MGEMDGDRGGCDGAVTSPAASKDKESGEFDAAGGVAVGTGEPDPDGLGDRGGLGSVVTDPVECGDGGDTATGGAEALSSDRRDDTADPDPDGVADRDSSTLGAADDTSESSSRAGRGGSDG